MTKKKEGLPFKGMIGELKIYNKVLDAAEFISKRKELQNKWVGAVK